MMRYKRLALFLGCILFAMLGAAGAAVYRTSAPSCDSDQVLDKVLADLRTNANFDSMLLNAVKTQSGWFLSNAKECTAQVTQVRGNTNADQMPWRAVKYRVTREAGSSTPVVTVALGDQVPLAPKAPSFWKRLLADL